MKTIHSILIANRGEIAVRIIKTARQMGIQTVALYSDQDEKALHVRQADRAIDLGSGTLQDTYLNGTKIIDLAQKAGVDAIHPGYGFLSENSDFARLCQTAGIAFIGPTPSSIETMGNKLEAAKFVEALNVPVLNMRTGTPDKILQQLTEADLPVMIKAASGGGGKGMRLVHNYQDLKETLKTTSREAQSYFGDGTVYVEKYVERPKHIEVQVMCDQTGRCIHLFERECSIQRRHQKIIEEAPSPTLSKEQRDRITQDATHIARAINYVGAGTIEFLFDEAGNHYFLEMNTRIQVEHPVTEMITRTDIVEDQIRIAEGHPLRYRQKELTIQGHAIEARLYAENPLSNFLPSPGHLHYIENPNFKNLRIDTGIESNTSISSNFDPMIAKIVAWGENRKIAIDHLTKGLRKSSVLGIQHNLGYLNQILQHPDFINNQFSTQFIDQNHSELLDTLKSKKHQVDINWLLAAYIHIHSTGIQEERGADTWFSLGYWRTLMNWKIYIDETPHEVSFQTQPGKITILEEETQKTFLVSPRQSNNFILEHNGKQQAIIYAITEKSTELLINGINFKVHKDSFEETIANKEKTHSETTHSNKHIKSPMFGKVLAINVDKNSPVKKGETLLVLEAMKMENNILAPFDTQIEQIHVEEGEQVEDGQILIQTSFN